jgi:hypothetical protein
VDVDAVPWLGQAVIIKSGVDDAVALEVGVTDG